MIAMAGPAEAAALFGFLLIGGGIILTAALLFLSYYRWAWISSIGAFVLAIALGYLLDPWSAFTNQPTSDPDDVSWTLIWRIVCIIWILCFAACAIRFGFLFRVKRAI